MSLVNKTSFRNKEVIFSEGDKSDAMYIIISGKVFVYKTGRANKKLLLAELGPGDILGEMSLISGYPRSATAIAASEVKTKIVTKKIFSGSVSGIPTWVLCIARVLIKRLRHMNTLIWNLSSENIYKSIKTNLNLTGKFSIRYDIYRHPDVIYLKGYFFSSEIPKVDEVIRKIINSRKAIVLDFSDVIDIDSPVVKYLTNITTQMNKAGIEFSINNIQLIHEKINTFTGFNNTISSIHPARRHVMVNDYLITQGDRDKNMYIVKQGRFDVLKTVGNKTITLAQVSAGDVIGEMSYIAGNMRSASVKAVKPSIVYVISERDLLDNKYNIPEWFLRIIHQLIHRVRQSNNTITGIFHKGHEKRVRGNEEIFEYNGKSCMVRIREYLTHEGLFEKLVGLINNGFKDILLDFTGITDIDAGSISSLNKIAASLKARHGKLRFCNANLRIKTQLKEASYFCPLEFEEKAYFPLIDKSYNCMNELTAGSVSA